MMLIDLDDDARRALRSAQIRQRRRCCALLMIAALCWGIGNVTAKTVLDHLNPLVSAGLRCLIAGLVILPAALLRDGLGRLDKGWWHGALGSALLFAAAVATEQIALGLTTVTNTAFLINTCSVMTPLLAWALLAERPGLHIALAAPMTLAGALMMGGASLSASRIAPGDLVALLSALFFALWMIVSGRHAASGGRPLATALVLFATAAAVLLPLGLARDAPSLAALGLALPGLLFLGIVATGVAYLLMITAQAMVSASVAAVVTSLEAVFGAIAAWLWLAERTAATGLAGAALILTAILMVALGEGVGAPAEQLRRGPALPAN